jgi:rhodanese-related sulfurtransferase
MAPRRKRLVVSTCFILIVLLAMSCAPATPTSRVPASPTAGPATKTLSVQTPTLVVGTPRSPKELQRIKPEELKALIDGRADIIVVDNQPEAVYKEGHIKGAINFPWEMEIKSPGNLPRDKLLILYCGCAHEEDSSDVAMQLIKFDYKRIMLLEGGWLRWVDLGYPVEKK